MFGLENDAGAAYPQAPQDPVVAHDEAGMAPGLDSAGLVSIDQVEVGKVLKQGFNVDPLFRPRQQADEATFRQQATKFKKGLDKGAFADPIDRERQLGELLAVSEDTPHQLRCYIRKKA